MDSPSNDLRSRINATPTSQKSHPDGREKPTSSAKSTSYAEDLDDGPTRISLLDVVRVLAGLFLLSGTLSYFITGNSVTWNYRPAFTRPARIKAWLVRAPKLKVDELESATAPTTRIPYD